MAAGQAQGMRLADGEPKGLTVTIAEAALGELGAEAEGASGGEATRPAGGIAGGSWQD